MFNLHSLFGKTQTPKTPRPIDPHAGLKSANMTQSDWDKKERELEAAKKEFAKKLHPALDFINKYFHKDQENFDVKFTLEDIFRIYIYSTERDREVAPIINDSVLNGYESRRKPLAKDNSKETRETDFIRYARLVEENKKGTSIKEDKDLYITMFRRRFEREGMDWIKFKTDLLAWAMNREKYIKSKTK